MAATEIPSLNAFSLVLVEHSDREGARLEIQEALTFDEQDRKLGQDTYSLSDETGATHYGGVARWSLANGSLSIELERNAAEALGVDGGFVLDLELDTEARAILLDGLWRLLGEPESLHKKPRR